MWYLGLEDTKNISFGYDKYIWMHEKCFEGIAWSKEHQMDYSVISRNWETDEEIQDMVFYLYHVKKEVMNYAAILLNKYHQSSFNVQQWNIMLNDWMVTYLLSFYDKYKKLLKVEKLEQNCECDLYDVGKMVLTLDFTEYCVLSERTADFSLYQYSQLYEERFHFLHVSAREIKEYKKPPVVYNGKSLGYYKVFVYRTLLRLLKKITGFQDQVVLQESYLPFDFLLELMKKKPGRITNYVYDFNRYERKKINTEVDYGWRTEEELLPDTEDEFVCLMCKLLKRNLPIAYVEGFAFLRKRADVLYRFARNPKAVFYAHGGVSYDEIFKAYLMTIKGSKTKFCAVQHGGNYGIERTLKSQNEYEMCDYFYTWGWKIEENFPCKCKPMPAAKLLDKRLQNVKMGNNILYVSYTFTSKEGSPDLSFYKRSLLYGKDKDLEIDFLKGLSMPLKRKLVVRLFQSDYGWHVKEDLEKYVPGLRYDEEEDFYSSLKQANLVVLMAWSTTILEALYAGKAILVLHDMGQAEASARADLMELKRVGILVETWNELGKRLEQIYQNVDEWWNKAERQKVVQRIKEKYIYMPENAKKIWVNEVVSLAEAE